MVLSCLCIESSPSLLDSGWRLLWQVMHINCILLSLTRVSSWASDSWVHLKWYHFLQLAHWVASRQACFEQLGHIDESCVSSHRQLRGSSVELLWYCSWGDGSSTCSLWSLSTLAFACAFSLSWWSCCDVSVSNMHEGQRKVRAGSLLYFSMSSLLERTHLKWYQQLHSSHSMVFIHECVLHCGHISILSASEQWQLHVSGILSVISSIFPLADSNVIEASWVDAGVWFSFSLGWVPFFSFVKASARVRFSSVITSIPLSLINVRILGRCSWVRWWREEPLARMRLFVLGLGRILSFVLGFLVWVSLRLG